MDTFREYNYGYIINSIELTPYRLNLKPLKSCYDHYPFIYLHAGHTVDFTRVNPPCLVNLHSPTASQACLAKAAWQMKIASDLQVSTDAKLCFNPPITPPVACCISAQVLPILAIQGRTVDVMLPDGNCLFRALSKALFAVQSGHIALRKLLVAFIESNKKVLGGLCNGTVESHCERMRVTSAFGTQAELQAAASLFQLNVYVFHKPSKERGWEWMCYKPQDKKYLTNVSFPAAPDTVAIEILYIEAASHFNLIAPKNNQQTLSPPLLLGTNSTFSIDLS